MASITIMQGHKNLIFAASVANETGAKFSEDGQWIAISNSPELVIPRYCFDQTFDPDGRRLGAGDTRLDSGWRGLLLNKSGHLVSFDDSEIVIADEKPKGDKRPQFLLRFPDEASKAQAEEWAARAGFLSLTDYILEAVAAFNQFWAEKAQGSESD